MLADRPVTRRPLRGCSDRQLANVVNLAGDFYRGDGHYLPAFLLSSWPAASGGRSRR